MHRMLKHPAGEPTADRPADGRSTLTFLSSVKTTGFSLPAGCFSFRCAMQFKQNSFRVNETPASAIR